MKIKSFLIIAAGVSFLTGCQPDEPPSPLPDANFSIDGYQNPTPTTINFLNTSVNASSYLWNFGDGGISTLENPTHQYTHPGTYLLKLKVTGPGGTDSVCKLMTLDALPAADKSAFSYFFDRCEGTPVGAAFKTLNPASTNTVWDFAGVVNVNRDPIIQFLLPGDYTIKYSSQINGVRDTVTRIIQIQ